MRNRRRSPRATLGVMWITLAGLLLIPACAGRTKQTQPPSNTTPAPGSSTPGSPAPGSRPAPGTRAPQPSGGGGGGVWHPAPVSIRVYPSTRFVKEDDQAILEARIELFDQMGDSIKSSGKVRCELYAVGGANETILGTRLYAWDIELATLDDQRTFYDPIIRGYVFRLRIDDLAIARRPTLLRVTFHPPTGDRLSTEGVVSSDW